MLVKDIIRLDQTRSPRRRQPDGVPSGRASAGGIIRRSAGFRRRLVGSRRRLSGSMDPRVCMVIVALGCVVTLFVPWLRLDGHTGSLSGVGLMSYALQGNDRTVMWRISPVATAALVSVPFGIAAGAIGTAWNALRGRRRADVPLVTFAAVLALLRFTPPILDERMHTLADFAVPGPGLGMLLAATVAVMVMGSRAALRRQRGPAARP